MKRCPNCNNEVPADAIKCSHCSADIPFDYFLEIPESDLRSTGIKSHIFMEIGALIAIAGAAFGYNYGGVWGGGVGLLVSGGAIYLVLKFVYPQWRDRQIPFFCPDCENFNVVYPTMHASAKVDLEVNWRCEKCGKTTRLKVVPSSLIE